eukprot:scaffold380168_cov35-Prasinocladus_malaysianus.AAC.2
MLSAISLERTTHLVVASRTTLSFPSFGIKIRSAFLEISVCGTLPVVASFMLWYDTAPSLSMAGDV